MRSQDFGSLTDVHDCPTILNTAKAAEFRITGVAKAFRRPWGRLSGGTYSGTALAYTFDPTAPSLSAPLARRPPTTSAATSSRPTALAPSPQATSMSRRRPRSVQRTTSLRLHRHLPLLLQPRRPSRRSGQQRQQHCQPQLRLLRGAARHPAREYHRPPLHRRLGRAVRHHKRAHPHGRPPLRPEPRPLPLDRPVDGGSLNDYDYAGQTRSTATTSRGSVRSSGACERSQKGTSSRRQASRAVLWWQEDVHSRVPGFSRRLHASPSAPR